MKLVARWGMAVVVSAAVFALAWWVCQRLIGLDEGVSLGVAGAVLAVALAIAGWWAVEGSGSGGSNGNGARQLVQKARADRDVYMAGGDQTVNNYQHQDQGLLMSGQSGVGQQMAAAGLNTYIAGRDQIIVDIPRAGPAELAVPSLLPRDAPAFTGREKELSRLVGLAEGGSVVVTAIGGTAGVGKTALAVHAAHKLLAEFPDGHLYADLHGYTEGKEPAEPGEVLELFLRRLGVPAEEMPNGTEDRSGLLRQLLAARKVLMVLDNARAEAQVRPLLPGAGRSLVLVTSRSVLAGLETNDRINLDVLPKTEAAAMLSRLIGTARATAQPEMVTRLAELCGRLPLALRVAGQLLAVHPVWPVSRLAEMLASEQDRLAQLGAGDLQVQAAFKISYMQLAQQDGRLFRLLGLHPGPSFTAAAAAALAAVDEDTAGAVLDRLLEVALVSEVGSGRFEMHELLRLFAQNTCRNADDQAARNSAVDRLRSYYASLAEELDSILKWHVRREAKWPSRQTGKPSPSLGEALARFEAERANLVAMIEVTVQQSATPVGLAAQRDCDFTIITLAEHMEEWLAFLRYYKDMLIIEKAALAAAQRVLDFFAAVTFLHHLGMAYEGLLQFEEALSCYERALAFFSGHGETGSIGNILNSLGNTYSKLGQFEDALSCYEQDLEICRSSGDRHGEGTTLNNVGTACTELRRFEEAVDFHQQALAIFREEDYRYQEGTTLMKLGDAHDDMRQFGEAADFYQQALVIFQETEDRRNESITLGNLGNVYGKLRQFGEAADCYQRAMVIFREAKDRRSEGITLKGLGDAHSDLQHFGEAAAYYRQALVLYRASGDRLKEGRALYKLGNAYQKMGQHDQAAACWREAAGAMRDAGDPEAAARMEQLAASDQTEPRSKRRRIGHPTES
jgi:tetratricopeptide (TPR) repeat protein